MRIKAFLLSLILLILIFIISSCIIINRSGDPADGQSESGQASQDMESGQRENSDEEETGSGTDSGIAIETRESTSGDMDKAAEDEFSDMIRVISPSPKQLISSPLIIKGEARGTWFFEASFPVRLLDGNGDLLVEHYAQTSEEWMTEDFISFTSQIEFDAPDTETGTLVLIKDNPSDIREYDAQIEIPVRFK